MPQNLTHDAAFWKRRSRNVAKRPIAEEYTSSIILLAGSKLFACAVFLS